jgi:fatty acid desaturase
MIPLVSFGPKDTKGIIKSRKSKKNGQHNDQKIPKGSWKAVSRRRTENIMTKRYQRLLMTPLVSFGHCVVRPSSIYGCWWPLWYLLVIVLSVLLRFTAVDDPFGILDTKGVIKSRKSKKDGQHNDQKIPTGSSKAVNRRRTDKISFGHCVVRSSSIYGFWWPLWYLLVIVLSVLLRFTAVDDP